MTDLKNIASIAAVVVASIGFFAAPTSAGATALTVGTGWQYDQASAQSIPSDGSPLTFTALSGAYAFSLVDGYIPGDEYTIVLNGVDIFSSTFGLTATPFVNNLGPYAATFAPEWTDTSFSRFEVWFGPGTYSFVVTDNSDIGYPAGFGYRLDALPTPEPVTLSLFGAGLAGAVAMRRRKKESA
jgi:hypothetical protein